MLTALPLDCCGDEDGAWMLVESLLLLFESLLFDVFDPVLVEPVPELLAEEPVLDEPVLEDVPVLDEPVLDVPVLAAACAPGSRTAITPAAATLLSPTAAVVTFSL